MRLLLIVSRFVLLMRLQKIIHKQVAGFQEEHFEIWKLGNCTILSLFHSFKHEGMRYAIKDVNALLILSCPTQKGGTGACSRSLVCEKDVNALLILIFENRTRKFVWLLQAMQYASPKAIWNLLFGTKSPPFGQKEGMNP